MTPIRIASVVILALTLIFWVIFLAGTGGAHNACVDINKGSDTVLVLSRRKLMGKAEDYCSNYFGLTWWIVFFQLFCMIAALLTMFVSSLRRFATGINLFLAIATAHLMWIAHDADTTVFKYKDVTGSKAEKLVSSTRAAMAGTVGLMIFNLLFIFITSDSESIFNSLSGGRGPMPSNGMAGNPAVPNIALAEQKTPVQPPRADGSATQYYYPHETAGAPAQATPNYAQPPAYR